MSLNIPNKLIIHCSATPPSLDCDAAMIDRWHRENNGWGRIGYHFVITRNGTLQVGRPTHHVGAHTYGHNRNSLGICLAGGMNEDMTEAKDNFTDEQWDTLRDLITDLCVEFEITHDDVHGHNEFASKACPSFDVGAKLDEWGV